MYEYKSQHVVSYSSYSNLMGVGQLRRYSNGLRAEQQGFDAGQGREIFLFPTISRLALGPTIFLLDRYRELFHCIKKGGGEH
jgi:hypothetical protein